MQNGGYIKIFFILSIFMLTSANAFSHSSFDAQWCRENGGKIEFDLNYNINFNCTTVDINSTPYIEKLYDIICIPCFSSILKKKNPVFLKLISNFENNAATFFDEYNFKITENELIRYI